MDQTSLHQQRSSYLGEQVGLHEMNDTEQLAISAILNHLEVGPSHCTEQTNQKN